MQDDQLFTGTIAENISLFDPDSSLDRVHRAARLAAIHEDIVAMPMGYHSLVGDMGSSLSGGQRQRVILARALYRNPKLLVLDEATSHLDEKRERLINNSVQDLSITRVIVAHRQSAIDCASRTINL
jgi:ATP-binding cassette subfamily B protein RaxB